MTAPQVSIIICTRNRAADLLETLKALRKIDAHGTELLIVDNGSTDNTNEVVEQFKMPQMELRLIHEPRAGKGNAYNRALAEAAGKVLLCTDDDVRPPTDWIYRMSAPILSGACDAVAGGVQIAPHLQRSWMGPLVAAWLASTANASPQEVSVMVGANMAFSREVLSKVPAFDEELGPGALGFAEDNLFSMQLKQAGFKIAPAWDVAVEHHFQPSRLKRQSLVERAAAEGRCSAYTWYHWEHKELNHPALRAFKYSLQLHAFRSRNSLPDEGITDHEATLIQMIYRCKQFLVERKRPRNYEKFGLKKVGRIR